MLCVSGRLGEGLSLSDPYVCIPVGEVDADITFEVDVDNISYHTK